MMETYLRRTYGHKKCEDLQDFPFWDYRWVIYLFIYYLFSSELKTNKLKSKLSLMIFLEPIREK